MPPKRKAAANVKAGGKKAKVEEDKPETTLDVIAKLKASENKSTSKKRKVDSFVPMSNAYEVMQLLSLQSFSFSCILFNVHLENILFK